MSELRVLPAAPSTPAVPLAYARPGPSIDWQTILRWVATISLGVAAGRGLAAVANLGTFTRFVGTPGYGGVAVFYIVSAALTLVTAALSLVGATKILKGNTRGLTLLVAAEAITLCVAVIGVALTVGMVATRQQPSGPFDTPFMLTLIGSAAGGIAQCAFPATVLLVGRGYRMATR